MAMIEEKDRYRAQPLTARTADPTIAAGDKGQIPVPNGQDHGIPTPATCQGPLVDLTPPPRRPGSGTATRSPGPKAQPGAGCPGARAEVKFAAGLRVPPPRYTAGTRQVYPRYMPCGMRATRYARRQAGAARTTSSAGPCRHEI